jgi:putative PIN family toxin of toxin-antitoxin system
MRYYIRVLGRVVLDTDVLVAAVRSDRGASRVLLIAALERRYPVMASVPLMLEYESVLTRPEHLAAAQISTSDVEVLLDALSLVVEPIRISYLWRPMLPDPGDDLVLETAVNGRADVVVTFNRRDFESAAPRFGLKVLAPAEAVRRLENRS